MNRQTKDDKWLKEVVSTYTFLAFTFLFGFEAEHKGKFRSIL